MNIIEEAQQSVAALRRNFTLTKEREDAAKLIETLLGLNEKLSDALSSIKAQPNARGEVEAQLGEEIWNALDGAPPKYACHIDTDEPDECTLDTSTPEDCVYVKKHGTEARKHCREWKPIQFVKKL